MAEVDDAPPRDAELERKERAVAVGRVEALSQDGRQDAAQAQGELIPGAGGVNSRAVR